MTKIIHEFRGEMHRLVIDGVESDWADYENFARLNDIVGTTQYYEGILPRVFSIHPVDGELIIVKDHNIPMFVKEGK